MRVKHFGLNTFDIRHERPMKIPVSKYFFLIDPTRFPVFVRGRYPPSINHQGEKAS